MSCVFVNNYVITITSSIQKKTTLALSVFETESYNKIDNSLSSEENAIAIDCENGNLLSIHVCLPKGYTKAEVPKKPTNVITTFEINNIREVNDKEMRITIDFYEELIWIDNRKLCSLWRVKQLKLFILIMVQII